MIIEIEARDDRWVVDPETGSMRRRCSRSWQFFHAWSEAHAIEQAREVWPNATSLRVSNLNNKERACV